MRGGLESTRLVADRLKINKMGYYIIFDYSLQYNISSTNYWEIQLRVKQMCTVKDKHTLLITFP